MVNRVRQNKALLGRKKFRVNHRENIHSDENNPHTEYNFPQASPDDLNKIKMGTSYANYLNAKQSTLIFILCMAAVALLLFIIINYASIIK
tara:strand:+ start:4449 stop:4721 length:273 start_codon:yes stop_codon:yes gene_type:complete